MSLLYFYFLKISWTLRFLEVVKGISLKEIKVKSNSNYHIFSPAWLNSLPHGEASYTE